jgi:hypothetical protein
MFCRLDREWLDCFVFKAHIELPEQVRVPRAWPPCDNQAKN